jgi:hypothetical protein
MFTDKDAHAKSAISDKCKENRRVLGLQNNQFSDLPVSDFYIESLQSIDVQLLKKSKWLNAVSANLSVSQLNEVKKLSFVNITFRIFAYSIWANCLL